MIFYFIILAVVFFKFIPAFIILPIGILIACIFKNVVVSLPAALLMCTFVIIVNIQYFIIEAKDVSLILHFIVMLIPIVMHDRVFLGTEYNRLENLFELILVIHIVLFFTILFDEVGYYFWIETGGTSRFQGLFIEPSILALFCGFLLFYYFKYSRNIKRWVIYVTIFLILSTVTGTGLVVLFVVAILNSKRIIESNALSFFILISAVLLIGVVSLFVTDVFEGNYLFERIGWVMSGNFDNSTLLRFFAPLEFIITFFNFPLLDVVFGISDPRAYIFSNQNDFKYFYIFDGTPTQEINNSLVVLFGMAGLLGFLSFMALIIKYFQRGRFQFLIAGLVFMTFSGHLVSPMFIMFLYAYCYLGRNEKVSGN